jgi:hypothetical protein
MEWRWTEVLDEKATFLTGAKLWSGRKHEQGVGHDNWEVICSASIWSFVSQYV